MITKDGALHYNEQLHPAFAGYLQDGTVTQKDALAAIFNLLTRGCIDPVWKNNSILEGLAGARLMNRKPQHLFEELIIKTIFGEKLEVTTKEISRFIKNGDIKKIIQENLGAISAFPIINEELKFKLGEHGTLKITVNGNPIDTVEEANAFKKIMNRVLLPVFIGTGVLLALINFLSQKAGKLASDYSTQNFILKVNSNFEGSPDTLLRTAIILGGTGLIFYLSFTFSRKVVAYDFMGDVVPAAKKKYAELYEFLKRYPLEPHRFTNEFLAFSIAFGLDNSWNKDFGLEEEIKIDNFGG